MLLNIRDLKFYDEGAVGNGIFYVSGFNALKKDGLSGLLHLLRREVAAHKATTMAVQIRSANAHEATGRPAKRSGARTVVLLMG